MLSLENLKFKLQQNLFRSAVLQKVFEIKQLLVVFVLFKHWNFIQSFFRVKLEAEIETWYLRKAFKNKTKKYAGWDIYVFL